MSTLMSVGGGASLGRRKVVRWSPHRPCDTYAVGAADVTLHRLSRSRVRVVRDSAPDAAAKPESGGSTESNSPLSQPSLRADDVPGPISGGGFGTGGDGFSAGAGSDSCGIELLRADDLSGSLGPMERMQAVEHASTVSVSGLFKCMDWCVEPGGPLAVGLTSGRVVLTSFGRENGTSLSLAPKFARPVNSLAWSPHKTSLLAAGLEKVRSDYCVLIWDLEGRIFSDSAAAAAFGAGRGSDAVQTHAAQPVHRLGGLGDDAVRVDPVVDARTRSAVSRGSSSLTFSAVVPSRLQKQLQLQLQQQQQQQQQQQLQQHYGVPGLGDVERPIAELANSEGTVALAWVPNRPMCIAAGTVFRWLRVYDLRAGEWSAAQSVVAHPRGVGGVKFDPFDPNRLATYDDTSTATVKLWDARRLAEPLLTVSTGTKALAEIAWYPSRSGVLATLARDEAAIKLWDVDHDAILAHRDGQAPGYDSAIAPDGAGVETLPDAAAGGAAAAAGDGAGGGPLSGAVMSRPSRLLRTGAPLSSFHFHPSDAHKLLALQHSGAVELLHMFEPMPLTWDACGAPAFCEGAMVDVVSRGEADPHGIHINADMRARAAAGYAADAEVNAGVLAREETPRARALLRAWAWVQHASSRRGSMEGVHGLLGMRPHRDNAAAAAANFASSTSARSSRLGMTVFRSSQRSAALAALGWPREVSASANMVVLGGGARRPRNDGDDAEHGDGYGGGSSSLAAGASNHELSSARGGDSNAGAGAGIGSGAGAGAGGDGGDRGGASGAAAVGGSGAADSTDDGAGADSAGLSGNVGLAERTSGMVSGDADGAGASHGGGAVGGDGGAGNDRGDPSSGGGGGGGGNDDARGDASAGGGAGGGSIGGAGVGAGAGGDRGGGNGRSGSIGGAGDGGFGGADTAGVGAGGAGGAGGPGAGSGGGIRMQGDPAGAGDDTCPFVRDERGEQWFEDVLLYLEDRDEFERAATLALFHLDVPRAVLCLTRGSEKRRAALAAGDSGAPHSHPIPTSHGSSKPAGAGAGAAGGMHAVANPAACGFTGTAGAGDGPRGFQSAAVSAYHRAVGADAPSSGAPPHADSGVAGTSSPGAPEVAPRPKHRSQPSRPPAAPLPLPGPSAVPAGLSKAGAASAAADPRVGDVEPDLSLVAMALGGFSPGKGGVMSPIVASLRPRLRHPYLRAMFALLCAADGGASAVLEVLAEPGVLLVDRIAFALCFLCDEDLVSFIHATSRKSVSLGDLESLPLTGLGSFGFDLLCQYVDLTGDVQSASLLASFAHPIAAADGGADAGQLRAGGAGGVGSGALASGAGGSGASAAGSGFLGAGSERVQAWLDAYRDLLNRWRLWHERARLDIALAARAKRASELNASGSGGGGGRGDSVAGARAGVAGRGGAQRGMGAGGAGGGLRGQGASGAGPGMRGGSDPLGRRSGAMMPGGGRDGPRAGMPGVRGGPGVRAEMPGGPGSRGRGGPAGGGPGGPGTGSDANSSQAFGLDVPSPQVTVRCNFCNTALTLPKVGVQGLGSGKRGGLTLSGGAAAAIPKAGACPTCKKPLPKCSICLQPLGTSAGPGRFGSIPGSTCTERPFWPPSGPDLDFFFTWCQQCRHGGHHVHIESWFKTHRTCPVSDCDCHCLGRDVLN